MNHDWTPSAADPRIETRWTGGGYMARWEVPVPATRERCPACRKDLVRLKAGLAKHKCDSQAELTYPRGYGYVRRKGTYRIFQSPSQAVAVAQAKAGFTKPMRQEALDLRAQGAS